MRTINYTVPTEYDGKKALHFLRGSAGLSSRLIAKLKVRADGILLNGEHVRTIDKITAGDIITVNIPEDENTIEQSDIPLDIIYCDDDIIVINKPAGLAMHPTHNHQGDTLANALSKYFSDKGRSFTFRAVGRLDKCTSGIVVCALNELAASKLNGKIEKTYFALVGGIYNEKGTIDKCIYRPDPMKTLRAAGDEGEYAVTHYEPIAAKDGRTLMRVTLETGRTHQIRVHFASMGTPLSGDEMYGSTDKAISRAALHCGVAEFTHPVTGEKLHFEAELPGDISKLI